MGMPVAISAVLRPVGTGMSAVIAEPPISRRFTSTSLCSRTPIHCATERGGLHLARVALPVEDGQGI